MSYTLSRKVLVLAAFPLSPWWGSFIMMAPFSCTLLAYKQELILKFYTLHTVSRKMSCFGSFYPVFTVRLLHYGGSFTCTLSACTQELILKSYRTHRQGKVLVFTVSIQSLWWGSLIIMVAPLVAHSQHISRKSFWSSTHTPSSNSPRFGSFYLAVFMVRVIHSGGSFSCG